MTAPIKRPLRIKADLSRPVRYQIKWRGEWVKIKSGIRIEDVFLIYELYDGTTGKVGPEEWRLDRLRASGTADTQILPLETFPEVSRISVANLRKANGF